jgi:pyruvate decarboxylase
MARMYHQMVQHISVASAVLTDPNSAASEIDRVLNGNGLTSFLELARTNAYTSYDVSLETSASFSTSHAVISSLLTCNSYIGVPVDMGPRMIPRSGLKSPVVTTLPPNDAGKETMAVAEVINLLKSRAAPVIVIDGGKLRQQCGKLRVLTR